MNNLVLGGAGIIHPASSGSERGKMAAQVWCFLLLMTGIFKTDERSAVCSVLHPTAAAFLFLCH